MYRNTVKTLYILSELSSMSTSGSTNHVGLWAGPAACGNRSNKYMPKYVQKHVKYLHSSDQFDFINLLPTVK